jgi:hypothetical protein
MHNHPRPHGFGGLAPNGKTDATPHATRDNRPELIAIEPKSVDVGTRHGSAAFRRSCSTSPAWHEPLSDWVTYHKSHHKIAKVIDVMVIEIASEVAISLAHSKYDGGTFQSASLPHCIIHRVGM